MLPECSLDFFEFDSETANLHLMIGAADVLNVAIGK